MVEVRFYNCIKIGPINYSLIIIKRFNMNNKVRLWFLGTSSQTGYGYDSTFHVGHFGG